MQCRICFEEGGDLLSPCRCRGTSSYIHRTCLDRYIQYYPDRICRVCHHNFPRYESPREWTLCWVVLSYMIAIILLSGARLLVKFALLGMVSFLSIYYLHRNLFSTTPIVFLAILSLLFLPGGHTFAVQSWLAILGCVAFVYTLARQLPAFVLLGIVVTLILAAYVGFVVVLAYHALDPLAFTVFLSVLYLIWYAWVHDHPLDEMRLRLA